MNMHLTKNIVKILICLVALYISVLTLVYSYDSSKLNRNIDLGLHQLQIEGNYPKPFFGNDSKIQLDNFTDIVMLKELKPNEGNKSSLYQAMNMNGYSRYWHGYVVVLRPLMSIWTYTQIRFISAFVLLGLFAYIFSIIKIEFGSIYAFGFFLTMMLIKFMIIPFSLQFTNLILVSFLSVVSSYMMLCKRRKVIDVDDLCITTMVVGSITAFVDLLTTPILPLGMVLIFAVVWNKVKYSSVIEIKFIIKTLITWLLGFATTWASKWLVGSIVVGRNILLDAVHQATYRMNGSGAETAFKEVSRYIVIKAQFSYLFAPKQFCIVFIALILLSFIFLFAKYRAKKVNIAYIKSLLLISALPIMWYLIIANHSQVHAWFTYRSLVITVISFLIIGCQFIDFSTLNKVKEQNKEGYLEATVEYALRGDLREKFLRYLKEVVK